MHGTCYMRLGGEGLQTSTNARGRNCTTKQFTSFRYIFCKYDDGHALIHARHTLAPASQPSASSCRLTSEALEPLEPGVLDELPPEEVCLEEIPAQIPIEIMAAPSRTLSTSTWLRRIPKMRGSFEQPSSLGSSGSPVQQSRQIPTMNMFW